jgi:hypothetical protein
MLLAQQYSPDLTKLKDYFIQTPLGYMVRGDMSGAVDKLGSNAKLRVDAMMNPETGLNAGLDFLTGGAGTITHKFLKPSMVGKAKLSGVDSSAMTRYEKKLKENPAFRRSEEMREAGKTELEQIPIGERTVLPPESLLGKVVVPVAGDMTRTGAKIKNIEGIPLQEEIIMQGGPLYSLQHKNMGSKNAWASNYGAASSKQKNFDKAAEEFGTDDILGVYTGMNPVTGSHFATPEAKIFVDTMDVLKPKVADIKEADQVIKDLLASQGKKVDFTSLRSDKIYDQMEKSGDLRRAITTVLRLPNFQSKGFTNAEDITRIIREPLLKDAKYGDSGLTIFKAKPNAGINPYAYHQSYDSGIQGEYLGGLLESVPAEIMFPKTFAKFEGKGMKTKSGEFKPYARDNILGSLARAHHAEMLDQQWLDNLMKYLSTKRK